MTNTKERTAADLIKNRKFIAGMDYNKYFDLCYDDCRVLNSLNLSPEERIRKIREHTVGKGEVYTVLNIVIEEPDMLAVAGEGNKIYAVVLNPRGKKSKINLENVLSDGVFE